MWSHELIKKNIDIKIWAMHPINWESNIKIELKLANWVTYIIDPILVIEKIQYQRGSENVYTVFSNVIVKMCFHF